MSEINPQISTAAVVAWRSRDTLKYLAEPDPKRRNLTFRTRSDKDSSFFEIFLAPVPQPVRNKLISQVLGFDFKLNENVTVLIPLQTKEQPMQGRTQSGVVLNNVREISHVASLSVYIDYSASCEAQLNSIRNAPNKGCYRSACNRQLDLQSLYNGQGAQIARFCTEPGQVPRTQLEQLPAYDEVASSSSNTAAQKRKRPRVEPHGQESGRTSLEAEGLQALNERMAAFELRQTS
ncbi:hypothetical protein FMEXI_2370 [Fusarium mexicanum]|uniref:Uncharacterized protein n=1 Tax=Fusarium mexicanum TaxID=751941 RepID=A0A8H5JI07_9HYPO|nr:hypothetical protein FMEXI_2370 [Fusarium mexicanum]